MLAALLWQADDDPGRNVRDATAVSTLLTFWPPFRRAKVSELQVIRLDVDSICCHFGRTKNDAKEVWRRAA